MEDKLIQYTYTSNLLQDAKAIIRTSIASSCKLSTRRVDNFPVTI